MSRKEPSLAREFYERFLTSPNRPTFLRGLVNSNPLTFETEWLEFKPHPYKDTDIVVKAIWSKTLSAFANSQGGVLVWGIGAKKVQKVDAARSIQLVPNPEELRTRLYELHHQATDPPLPGIEIKTVADPNEAGQGFVVCFVPAGDSVPYRAEHCEYQYYMRVGDSSVVPSRVMLRRLFYPQSLARPEISVVAKLERNNRGSVYNMKMKYEVYIINSGTSSANDTHVILCDNVRYDSEGSSYYQGDFALVGAEQNRAQFSSTKPIHPGQSAVVGSSRDWGLTNHTDTRTEPSPNFEPFGMRFRVFSRDSQAITLQAAFTKEDFMERDLVDKKCFIVEDGINVPLGKTLDSERPTGDPDTDAS